ncbi:uncharacterized protein TNIN_467551 [Trichonephila inaurata madagascariensis]|uniref:Uncharacterized protein n=1 Tax=Trichonephila inaurata madagascariensis TaxID=2747483 RepID=A0A8X7C8K7_9ARAC|nr:uncharacterized protein TNIN_467551 [Trichonephila inaurata madagascariensis]
MEKSLEDVKSKRKTLRSLTTKLITKVESIIKDESISYEDEIEDLIDCKEQLLDKQNSLKELNEKIESLIKSEEIEKEVSGSEEYSEISWLEFWSQFQTAIHENSSLSEVQKFVYLKNLLGGVALNAIKGFALTKENYEKSVSLLNSRFGREDLIINSHMNKLLNLEPVRNSSNIRALRRLYDELEINIRSLESLNVVSGTYGQLLCPILLKLIPEDISLEYNRKRKSNSEFDVSELVNFIKTEVECRENSKLLHAPNNYSQEGYKKLFNRNIPTATTLNTNIKSSCLFCKSEHNSFCCESFPVSEKIN